MKTLNTADIVSITIMGRNYKIKCTPNEASELQAAAQYVDEKMRAARQSGMNTAMDRVAIITALNISHELIQLKNQKNTYIDSMHEKIQTIQNKVQAFLTEDEEIAV